MLHTIEAAPIRPTRTAWIKRHPLSAFFAWFFTVGQAFAFAPLVVDTPIPDQVFIIGSTLVGLFLPALVITRIADGPEALRRLLRSYVHWRVGLRWYALVLLVPLIGLALGVAFFGLPDAVTAALVPVFAIQLVLAFLPNNWAEEGVWTGFVQARLQRRHGPVLAALITGPLFALQHIALMVDNPPLIAVLLLVFLAIMATSYRFLTGWLFNRTGSLFLLGLLHAGGNATAAGSGFDTDSLLRHLYPAHAEAVGVFHLLAFFAIGLVVLAVTKGRLGLPISKESEK